MDLMLIGFNGVVVALGIVILLAGIEQKPRWLAIVFVILGISLIIGATAGLPSRALQAFHGEGETVQPHEQSRDLIPTGDDSGEDTPVSLEDDDSADEEADKASEDIIIYGNCETLELLLERGAEAIRDERDVSAAQQPEEDSTPTPEQTSEQVADSEPEPTPAPARDPFVAPAVITPQRERSLPEEPLTGEPKCSSPALLHGPSGGPGQGGCHAVGCAEGYALPMKLLPDRWVACTNPTRFERIEDCYYFHDSDGSERSVRFNNGSWMPCE